MKKYFYIALTLILATSCLDNGKYSSTDQQLIDFQAVANANIFDDNKLDHYDNSFQYLSFFFYTLKPKTADGKVDEKEPFSGGCAIGRLSDTTLVTRTTPFSHYSVYAKPVEAGYTPNYFVVYEDNEDDKLNPVAAISYAYNMYGKASPVSITVNNTTETIACSLGLVPGCTVKDGDYLKATISGYTGNAEESTLTGSVEVYLLDYRAAHTVVAEWKSIELKELKEVDFIKIRMESNNPALPHRFCLDDFQATVTINM